MDGPSLTRRNMKGLLQVLRPFVGLLLVVVVFALHPRAEGFLSLYNMKTVANQTVIVGLGAIGMTFVIVSGGIDLSIGSVMALGSVVTAIFLRDGLPVPLAMLGGVLAGGVCGAINGLLITGLKVVPFIVTLGMLGVARGVAKFIADEMKVDAPSTWLSGLMTNNPEPAWLLVSPGVWTMLLLALLMGLVLRRTVLGTHTFAIGSNEATARLCGVPVARGKIIVYTICGLFGGLAGVFLCARLTVGNPTDALGKELDVIAAVVIGGASLAGGEGSILGSLVGALMMAFLASGCKMAGSATYVQEIVIGAIIVTAVAVDRLQHRRRP
jgi:ribose transport system permease protein